LLVVSIARWLNRQQRDAIDYLREENRVPREQLDGKRLRLNDDQRRRLAAKAKMPGRRILREVATIVTPETLLAWRRKLIARKYDGSKNRGPGHPELAMRLKTRSFAWPRRTGIGAAGGSRVRWPIRAMRLRAASSRTFPALSENS